MPQILADCVCSQKNSRDKTAQNRQQQTSSSQPTMAIQTASPTIPLTTTPMVGSDVELKHQHRIRKLPSNSEFSENGAFGAYEQCDKIDLILSELSYDDHEILARSSFQYLKSPVRSQRKNFAARVVYRILESKKGDVASTLRKVKKVIDFHRAEKIDELITAFDNEESILGATAQRLKKHIATKKYYVQGFDKEGRSTLNFIPRNVVDHDLDTAIYSMERAIASTRSLDQTVNCIVDYADFSISNGPPLELGKKVLSTLRLIYSGQIHRIFLVNVSFSFSILWSIFSPFVGTDTRDKISIIRDNDYAKEKELLNLYDRKELPNWAVPGGEKNRTLDVEEYLFALPFDSAFDDQ